MIRVFVFMCLLALPAQAQDFRGLLPGMNMSELARLGEPIGATRGDPSSLVTVDYEIGAEHLSVTYDADGRILRLVAWRTPRQRPDDFGPTTSFPVTIEDARRIAGSEGWYFALEGQHNSDRYAPMWRLYYDLPEHPDLVLGLRFLTVRAEPPSTEQPGWGNGLQLNPTGGFNTAGGFNTTGDYQHIISGDNQFILPPDAQLLRAVLFHLDYFEYDPDRYGDPSRLRPGDAPYARRHRFGSAPFAPTLSEAFPLTQTP